MEGRKLEKKNSEKDGNSLNPGRKSRIEPGSQCWVANGYPPLKLWHLIAGVEMIEPSCHAGLLVAG